jgi:hypothetical protein
MEWGFPAMEKVCDVGDTNEVVIGGVSGLLRCPSCVAGSYSLRRKADKPSGINETRDTGVCPYPS